MISKVTRYDVKGRKYIGSLAKYYFEDIGLRNARLNFRQVEETHIMENILYNELRFRGYNVDVGVVEQTITNDTGKRSKAKLEVDFVATKGSKKYYLQSAFSLRDTEKTIREERPLHAINDTFKKMIITGDNINPRRNEYGIVTVGIINFLLDEDSLESGDPVKKLDYAFIPFGNACFQVG